MGKGCAKVMEARVFAARWPSELHYLCDNEFGMHLFLPWSCVSKFVVFYLQISIIMTDPSTWQGASQAALKGVLILWSAYRMVCVFRHRAKLRAMTMQDFKETRLPGVQNKPKGTYILPEMWLRTEEDPE